VWAADLWVDPTQNWGRIREAEVGDLVTPIRLEAHDLPFAEGFFDFIVCVDAYEYFGTDDLYLGWTLAPCLADGGRIGIVGAGTRVELDEVPEDLAACWQPDFWTWHSPAWWRRHWDRSGVVSVELADLLLDGWNLWRTWAEVLEAVGQDLASDAPRPSHGEDPTLRLLEADRDRLLGFTRVVARKQTYSYELA
jgi:cyclopropane fatty-acyl-phospholipid synthase-like methyltransferase